MYIEGQFFFQELVIQSLLSALYLHASYCLPAMLVLQVDILFANAELKRFGWLQLRVEFVRGGGVKTNYKVSSFPVDVCIYL
jgi:hypothetical protein